MNKKKNLTIIFLLVSFLSFSQEKTSSLFSLHLVPGIGFPLGESADYFNPGLQLKLSGERRLSESHPLYLGGEVKYRLNPIKNKKSISILSAGMEAGITFPRDSIFQIKVFASIGGYYSFFNYSTEYRGGGSGFLSAGAGLSFFLTPYISLGLNAAYTNYFGLLKGIEAQLGASFHFEKKEKKPQRVQERLPVKPKPLEKPPKEETKEESKEKPIVKGEGVEIRDIEFESIFPIFFKYYDEHPVGRAKLYNFEDDPVTDVKVELFVKQYMDTPKECIAISEIEGGGSRAIELYALFTDEVLKITEGTKVAAEITATYKLNGESNTYRISETIRIYNRNALTWDDNRKVSAFVTAKDPEVLSFSKILAAWTRGVGSRAIDKNLRLAMAVHNALKLSGITYVVDPTTPFKDYFKEKFAVDFLQFPRQTLEYQAGDCDDLSILYAALLEAVGIETAFITTPGHIFIAFTLDMAPDKARYSFLYPDELIFRDEKAWVPLEITKVQESFIDVWVTGAKEWREGVRAEQAEFYPTHEAWAVYEPVGFPEGKGEINIPQQSLLVKAFIKECNDFIEREINPQVAKLQRQIRESNNSPQYVNRLGVLYARYGLFDKAMEQFNTIISLREYFPALINMGNIYYMQHNIDKSLAYYQRAEKLRPDHPKTLLSLARIHHDLENYGFARRYYEKLESLDPARAEMFSYLALRGEEADRAAQISGVKEVVLWVEE
ncbi:MAG: hypothetical protein DRP87_19185 [Spirochaetes bacterium]|nr:MAG: hypothetical protein DRP87_19185 [Spirochaetota bacterium]